MAFLKRARVPGARLAQTCDRALGLGQRLANGLGRRRFLGMPDRHTLIFASGLRSENGPGDALVIGLLARTRKGSCSGALVWRHELISSAVQP